LVAASPALHALDGDPVVGHLLAFRRDPLSLLQACAAAPGDVIQLRIVRPAYLLRRAEDVRHVLMSGRVAYAKSARNTGSRATRIFGDGLITSDEGSHRAMRHRTQPVFTREAVAGLDAAIVRGVDAMLDRWAEGAELDLGDEMAQLGLRTLIATVFGVEDDERVAAIEAGVLARRRSMNRAFDAFTLLPAFLPLAVQRDERRAIRRLDEIVAALIDERGAGHRDDLLSMVMGTHGDALPSGRAVYEEVLAFVLAAYENVGRALTWTFMEIARHPAIAARLHDEFDRVLGGRAPTARDAADLPYAEMTLAESLRLRPPNAVFFRIAKRDDVLPTGARIAAGSKLLISPYVLQRDPAYYPDPERFDPERFSPAGRQGRPRYAYIPFGGGPRVCIGQPLAMLQCKLVLARVAQRVRLELVGERPYACGSLPAASGPWMRPVAA
jgi:cytochrome P450